MPAEERSAALTDAYRARLVELRRRALLVVDAAWILDIERLDETFGEWLDRAETLLAAVQEQSAALSVAYVAEFVASELDEPATSADIDTEAPAGVTQDGRPLREVLAPALLTVKRSIGAGLAFELASNAGRARALRNSTTELTAAADAALDEALEAEPRVKGWRRVTSRRPCGACLGLATGNVERTKKVILRHPHCSCSKEPVVDGVRERVRRPTGAEVFDRLTTAEQDRLFAGRGGKEKAELVRSGKVDVADLVSHDHQALDGRSTIVSETALDRLT